MADKSWLSRLNPFNKPTDLELESLKKRLEDITSDANYEVKGIDADSSSFNSSYTADFSGIDQQVDTAALQKIYCTETWVYAAVSTIATTIAELPIKLEKKRIINKKVIDEYSGLEETVAQSIWTDASGEKLAYKFQFPNPCTTKTEFIMLLVIDLLTAGEYFVYLDSDENLDSIDNSVTQNDPNSPFGRLARALEMNTQVKGMYRIPPYLIKPVLKKDSAEVEGYLQASDKGSFTYKASEIIHVKLPNPTNPVHGLSPLIPAFKPILLDRFSTEHMIRFYKSGARLGGVITTEKSMNKEQLGRFQRSFEGNFTGRANHHRTLILPPGMKYEQIEQNPAETALLDFCKYNRDAILSVYRVPPIKVGIMDNANYANARVQLVTFFTDAVKPILSFMQDGFTYKNTLMPVGDSYRIRFDLSNVEELKENFKEKAESAKFMIEAGLTVNEVRKRIWELGPLKGGDKAKAIEEMDKPQGGFPFQLSAPEGTTKDAVSGVQADNAIITDITPTKVSFSIRVSQLTEQFLKDGLPLHIAIDKAIEQAKTEGFTDSTTDPDDNGDSGKPSTEDNADNDKSDESSQPKETSPDAVRNQSIDEFILDALSKLDPSEQVTAEFIAQLVDLYKKENSELVSGKESNIVDSAEYIKPDNSESVVEDQVTVYANGWKKEQIVDHWKSFISKTDPFIEKRKHAVIRFFKEFKSIVMNRIGANLKSYGMHKARDKDDVNDILKLDAYDKLIDQYIKEIDQSLSEAYKFGFNDTLTEFAFKAPSEAAKEFLRKYAADKVKGIIDTTRDQLKTVLSDAFEEGVAITEVSQRVREKFDEMSEGRADTIARTETLTAVSAGRQEKREEWIKQFPDKKLKKQWVSAQDDRVRDSHVELDGTSVDVDAEFKEGLRYPRDPNGAPEEVINCRCTDITFMEEDEQAVAEELGSSEDETE